MRKRGACLQRLAQTGSRALAAQASVVGNKGGWSSERSTRRRQASRALGERGTMTRRVPNKAGAYTHMIMHRNAQMYSEGQMWVFCLR